MKLPLNLPIVTQHALLRFIERALGIDVESLRRQMAEAAAVGVKHGAGVVIWGGAKLVIEDRVVVTALPRNAVTSETATATVERPLRPVRRRRRRKS
ncbi:MAG: hypothetical protein WD871_01720 [Xanthobacteraceae bacterium]